ncbi:helix-turn-helix transcriptional regulator [Streptomyces sp. B6B3]|uniref:helix-turn-helix domain-containing protein n=1 Tax=Streptomyces sp. B6B3 TaxID=3153570 RepID=UPI00325D2751
MPPKNGSQNPKPNARRVFAQELQKLRAESGWSLAELGERSMLDRTHLNRLERGERLGERRNAEILDEVYGAGRHLQNLWDLAREQAYLDRYVRYMRLAEDARIMWHYSVSTVPGLLQTEEYAREQLGTAQPRDEERLAEQVSLRLARQARLVGDEPLHLRAILDESALRRELRDPAAWARQLEHLVTTAERDNVTVQVLPFAAGLHYLLGGCLTILSMPDGRPVAYLEGSTSGDLIEDTTEVDQLRLAYDQLRDVALSPRDSLEFIRSLMEKDSRTCEPPDPT